MTVIIAAFGMFVSIVFFGIVLPGKFVVPNFMIRPKRNISLEKKIEVMDYVEEESIHGELTLNGYVMEQTKRENVIVFFGGISESAAFSIMRFNKIRENGGDYDDYDIAVVDWPEFGKSEGKASEDSLKKASVVIAEHYKSKYRKMIIMGYSMGTGYATYAASKVPCDQLILIAPYYSSTDLINHVIPVFFGPLENILSYQLPVYRYAHMVSAETLVIGSRSDRRIPFKSSKRLAGCFHNGCQILEYEGLTHEELPADDNVTKAVRCYLERKAHYPHIPPERGGKKDATISEDAVIKVSG